MCTLIAPSPTGNRVPIFQKTSSALAAWAPASETTLAATIIKIFLASMMRLLVPAGRPGPPRTRPGCSGSGRANHWHTLPYMPNIGMVPAIPLTIANLAVDGLRWPPSRSGQGRGGITKGRITMYRVLEALR
ncbi:MAG: hypothetical protein ACF8QF_08930, partial [Phycisphaerales bacterium]